MKRILLPILAVGALLLSACGAQTTPPPGTATITPPPETATITPPPGTATITPPTQIIENITPQEAYTLIQDNKDNPNFVVLDVRNLDYCGITGNLLAIAIINVYPINIDYVEEIVAETFRDKLNYLDKNRAYLIYSNKGDRSEEALAIMEELGFQEVYNMLGGIDAWQEEGLPVAYVGVGCGEEEE